MIFTDKMFYHSTPAKCAKKRLQSRNQGCSRIHILLFFFLYKQRYRRRNVRPCPAVPRIAYLILDFTDLLSTN